MTEGRPVTNVRRGRNIFLLSVPDDRRVYHQLTEEDIIFYEQADKLLYNEMKKLIPPSADGKEEHLYLVFPRNKLLL